MIITLPWNLRGVRVEIEAEYDGELVDIVRIVEAETLREVGLVLTELEEYAIECALRFEAMNLFEEGGVNDYSGY